MYCVLCVVGHSNSNSHVPSFGIRNPNQNQNHLQPAFCMCICILHLPSALAFALALALALALLLSCSCSAPHYPPSSPALTLPASDTTPASHRALARPHAPACPCPCPPPCAHCSSCPRGAGGAMCCAHVPLVPRVRERPCMCCSWSSAARQAALSTRSSRRLQLQPIARRRRPASGGEQMMPVVTPHKAN